jgi:hypothetical protein
MIFSPCHIWCLFCFPPLGSIKARWHRNNSSHQENITPQLLQHIVTFKNKNLLKKLFFSLAIIYSIYYCIFICQCSFCSEVFGSEQYVIAYFDSSLLINSLIAGKANRSLVVGTVRCEALRELERRLTNKAHQLFSCSLIKHPLHIIQDHACHRHNQISLNHQYRCCPLRKCFWRMTTW